MANINSLFDCFEESAENEAAIQFPTIQKDTEKWYILT